MTHLAISMIEVDVQVMLLLELMSVLLLLLLELLLVWSPKLGLSVAEKREDHGVDMELVFESMGEMG